MAITRAQATVANGFPRRGFRAALNHRHHPMTGCPRPRQLACHQASSRSLSLMPTVPSLASTQSTARCGFALTTHLLAIARTTRTGWMLGAPNSPARPAGTPLSFHLDADREPAPEFLDHSLRRSSGPALRSDQRNWRQTVFSYS